MGFLETIYRKLPAPARSWAASWRGWQLNRWRFGPETEQLVAAARERDFWTADQWKAHREERLARILHRAATRVPYYREHWARRRSHGDRASCECLEHWPILDKETLRRQPAAFVADDCDVRRMQREYSSGTTGTPAPLWFSRSTSRAAYALFEARCRRWYGLSRHDRWAMFSGQMVVPFAVRRPPFWVWNASMSQLYMSVHHLAPNTVEHYLDAMRRHEVTYVLAFPSALDVLAEHALRAGCRRPDLKLVITQSEPLYEHQRGHIAEFFRCPIRETYGMAEILAAGSQCEHGRMHLWPSLGHLELFNGDEPVSEPNCPGDLVATGFYNADMPLIRFRTGDRIALASPEEACPCGRRLPIASRIDGRASDTFYTVDGRAISRLDPIFKTALHVREVQLVQEALDRIRVRYVPDEHFTEADATLLASRVRERMGDVEVVFQAMQRIPRTAAGKFRTVVSELPPSQRGSQKPVHSPASSSPG